MQKLWIAALLPCVLLAAEARSQQQKPLLLEHGTYQVYSLLHAIGAEEYVISGVDGGHLTLTTTTTVNDRGTTRVSSTTLETAPLSTPIRMSQQAVPANPDGDSVALVTGASVTVREGLQTRKAVKPATAFLGLGTTPAAVQMMLMRYWRSHHEPASLPMVRLGERALPLEIRLVGHDAFEVKGRFTRLARYTIKNLVFGREVVWMNDSGRLAAVMTFAAGLPQEEVLDEYESFAGELVHSGVQQEMLDLADIDREVPLAASGAYAIVGARLVDVVGGSTVENSTVVIRDGRIAAVGGPVPVGMRVIHAEGKTLLPGLWEMHTHYSGVEFGPALLAAGVTTARDCGGEFEFLTTLRRKIATEHVLGPRLLLAGLIDSGGPLAFGSVDVSTVRQAVAAVDNYANAKFDQIKVYTQLKPEILRAIAAKAHERGMTVTGHVPAAMDALEGIADGMDQINHLQFVIRAMNPDGGTGPVDLNSERAQRLIALLKEKQIVVDPTDGWGEMAGHPRSEDVSVFEPGILGAPYPLAAKYRAMGVPAAGETAFRERMETNRQVVHALYLAGVPIVAGSDTGLVGYGLDRELELYVQAGMTPLAAIQTATINAAKAMRLEKDSGSIEVGKRADLMLVDGNPLARIGDIRRVVSVVTDGRMYDSKALGRSVGFVR